MSFKYCSFYGISAPIILLFTRRDIDMLFEHGMSGSACRLLANLRFELLALKEFLSNKSAIDMSEDTESATVKYFINGFSMQLDRKFPESKGSNLKKSSYFDSNISDTEKDFLNLLAQATKISGDFIEFGKTAPEDYQARFSNLFEVKRYVMRDMAKDLSESEQQLVKTQLSRLPRKPSGKVFLDGKTLDLKVTNPALAALLTSLYGLAFKPVDDTVMIDYILTKIELILDRNPVYGTTLLGRAFPNLREIKTVRKANMHNLQIINGPLSTENQQARHSAILSYLADCDSMLDGNAQALKAVSRNLNFNSMSMADIAMLILDSKVFRDAGLIDAQSELVSLLKFLQSKNLHKAMTMQYRELLFLTFILHKLTALENGGAIYGWGLTEYMTSAAEVNQLGIEAAKLFKLGGLYVGYTQHVYDTIMICNKTFTRDNYQINKASDPVLFDNIRLIKRYLLSLKERGA